LIYYGKQSIDQSDIDAVVEVLKGDWITQGPAVERFENDLKLFFGAKHASAVSNGTAALHLTGLVLGWQPSDIVITSPITFIATANCIVYSGATPDFVDIDPVTYTIDPNQLEEKVKTYQSQGKKVKAVIGMDYAGHPCGWKALREIADIYDLQLVNDNCHSLGASYFGDQQYAVEYADVVTQSYHPVKHITTGEGGAVLTNNPEIEKKVKRLRNHCMIKNPNQMENNDGPWYYEIHEVGYNYRITDFQCVLGSSQLKKLDQFVQKRREIAKKYNELFSDVDYLKIPETSTTDDHAYHLYPLLIDYEKLQITKLELFEKMKQAGINLQVHYFPVHLQPFYQKNYGFNSGDFPVSENFYRREVSLPIYPHLSIENVSFVVNNILEIIFA
jgi:UDP-4-amino-4,6-dideoxy-N-acetyl-beta-L-altrosamine transaminase